MRKIKRAFTLLELLIAMSLSAILLTILFRFLVSNAHVERQIEKAQGFLLERQRLQERLESLLTNIEPQLLDHPSFYTDPISNNKTLSLIAVFNAGIDPDPAYSGPNTARLYLTKEGNFCLTQWPLKEEGSRTETLLANVRALEWEFLGHPSDKNPHAVAITDNWSWLKTWPKNKGALPSIIRLKFWCGIDKNLQREPNLQLAVILPKQEPIKIAKQ